MMTTEKLNEILYKQIEGLGSISLNKFIINILKVFTEFETTTKSKRVNGKV